MSNNINKFLTKSIKNLIDIIVEAVQIKSPVKNDHYKRNVKYHIRDYVIGILDVLRSNISWNSYNGHINGNTLRKKHSEWSKLGVYDHSYQKTLTKYFQTTPVTNELKYQSIDSTFVQDINGSKCSGYSGIYKHIKGESAKGIKITSRVTTNGIPISIHVDPANKHDSPILPEVINHCFIECNTYKYRNHNRYKQYLLADSGYDSHNNHKLLCDKGFIPIIIQNKKNIKNPKLIRKLTNAQTKKYKKRIIIENYHSWIKKFPKIKSLYERNIQNYYGLFLIAISIVIQRRIIKNTS